MLMTRKPETKKATVNRDFCGDMSANLRSMEQAPEPTYVWPDFNKDNKAHAQAKAEFGVTDCSNISTELMSAIALRAQEIKKGM